MDRGAWWATVHGVTKSQAYLTKSSVALAVSASASWLMPVTSGELVMMTWMWDKGSDTDRWIFISISFVCVPIGGISE